VPEVAGGAAGVVDGVPEVAGGAAGVVDDVPDPVGKGSGENAGDVPEPTGRVDDVPGLVAGEEAEGEDCPGADPPVVVVAWAVPAAVGAGSEARGPAGDEARKGAGVGVLEWPPTWPRRPVEAWAARP
jgi:hypothetical protein